MSEMRVLRMMHLNFRLPASADRCHGEFRNATCVPGKSITYQGNRRGLRGTVSLLPEIRQQVQGIDVAS